jgi:tetratricopeptide (TPR) repeat protein
MRRVTIILAAAIAAVSLPSARVARADELEALVRKGVEFRRQGKEQEALEMFQRAAEIRKTARVMAQMALAEQALGLWVKAETDLKIALEDKGDPWVTKNRGALTEAMKTVESHLASLEVWGTPNGAEVFVDGHSVGRLPSSGEIRLPLGEVTVTVRKPAFAAVTRVVHLPHSGIVRENVDLYSLPVAVDPSAGASTSQGAAGTALMTERASLGAGSNTDTDEPQRPVYKRWWFWTVVGVAVAGAGTGAYLFTHRGAASGCDAGKPCLVWGTSQSGN